MGYWIIAFLSTSALISFLYFLYLSNRKNKDILLYEMLSANRRYGKPTLVEKVFLIMAALFVCAVLWKGANTTFFWIPKNWGGVDEFGDFFSFADSLSSIFTFIAAPFTIQLMVQSVLNRVELRNLAVEHKNLEVKVTELKKIIEWKVKYNDLELLKNEYKIKIDAAEEKLKSSIDNDEYSKNTISLYKDLLSTTIELSK